MALCILLIACLLHRRFSFILPFGFLLSGFALLVSYLGQMNPQITPLMPVLVSPWLSIHVSLIMMSYALLAFIMLNGILALCLRKKESENNVSGNDAIQDNRIEQLTLVSRLLLCHLLFRSRHLSGSSLGKRFLGTILGVGPERSMGTDYFSGIWSSLPFTKSAHFPQASILPYLYDSCFPDRLNDLFRGKLCSWRDA